LGLNTRSASIAGGKLRKKVGEENRMAAKKAKKKKK
jgi:hypothetical protein